MIHGGDKLRLRKVAQVLRAVVGEVEVREQVEGLTANHGFDVVVVNYDSLSPEERSKVVRINENGDGRLLVMSSASARDDFANLFGQGMLTNLVAHAEDLDAWELIVTIQKMLRRDIFGIEKYFSWGIEPVVVRASSSEQKGEVVGRAEAFAQAIGVERRLGALFCSVADELFTNAIYNAPVDANGKSRFAHRAREDEVSLSPGEEVQIKLCCDGLKLGISASDPFGSLTRERLLQYLGKCFRKQEDQMDEKAGGAGLGLYYVFESLSHFVVNISPGKQTEMIGLIDVRGTFKDFASRQKSFNVFMAQ
jgi:hypothetical protein